MQQEDCRKKSILLGHHLKHTCPQCNSSSTEMPEALVQEVRNSMTSDSPPCKSSVRWTGKPAAILNETFCKTDGKLYQFVTCLDLFELIQAPFSHEKRNKKHLNNSKCKLLHARQPFCFVFSCKMNRVAQ